MKNSYSQQTNYYVVFGTEKLNDIKYYLKGCNIPGVTLEPVEIGNKVHAFNIGGDKIEFNPLVLDILIDEDFDTYLDMINEIFSLKNPNTGEINRTQFNLNLFITSNKGNPILNITYQDCFITSIGDIEMNDGDADVSTLHYNVTIKYSNVIYTKIK